MNATTKQFVDDLYNGLEAFYPESVHGGPGKSLGYKNIWPDSTGRDWEREDFAFYAMNWTNSSDIFVAGAKVVSWRNALLHNEPAPDMPPEELLEKAKEEEALAEKQFANIEAAKAQSQKLALKHSQEYHEKPTSSAVNEKVAVSDMIEFKISAELAETLTETLTKTAGKVLNVAGEITTSITGTKSLGNDPEASRAHQNPYSISGFRRRVEQLEGKIDEERRTKLFRFADSLESAQFSFYKQSRLTTEYASIEQIVIGSGRFTMGEASSLKAFVLSSAQGAVGGVIKKGLTKAITAALVSSGAIEAATGVGIPLAAIQAAVAVAVGWVSDRIEDLALLAKKYAKYVVALGGGIFLLGASSGSVLAASAGAGIAGLGIANGGFKGGVGSVGRTVQAFFGGLVLPSLAAPLISILIGFPLVVALILFIINSGAYLVPPSPSFDSPFGESINCSKDKADVSTTNNSSSPIARRAWQITSDLYQGFWCFWNRSPGDFPGDLTKYSPSYPELFDETVFARNPSPSRQEISACGDCMFWCTYLIQKSYRETGNKSLAATLWSPTMQDDFNKRGKLLPSSVASNLNVLPGSVIFFKVSGGPDRTNHVGLVYTVDEDSIVYIQSNAPTKSGLLSFNKNGIGIQSLPGIEVMGIGLP